MENYSINQVFCPQNGFQARTFYYNGHPKVANDLWNLVEPFRIQEDDEKDQLWTF